MQIHVEYTYLNGNGPKLKTFTSVRYILQGSKSILFSNRVSEYSHQHELVKNLLSKCKHCVYVEMLNEQEKRDA